MDEFNEPMIMFPPDTLVERMEQLRKMVEDMCHYSTDSPEWKFLSRAADLLLVSCKIPEPSFPANLHTVH